MPTNRRRRSAARRDDLDVGVRSILRTGRWWDWVGADGNILGKHKVQSRHHYSDRVPADLDGYLRDCWATMGPEIVVESPTAWGLRRYGPPGSGDAD